MKINIRDTNINMSFNLKGFVIALIFLPIYVIELMRTAWLNDDAAITFRSIMNFVHGYGPTYNIDERVQAYTHPLWFLIQSAVTFVFKNIIIVNYSLSIGLSLLTFWILSRYVSKNLPNAIIVAVAMILSQAFVEYSTSGLENPLSHLLILLMAIFGVNAIEKEDNKYITYYFLVCSLLYLTRQDMMLLAAPMAIMILVKNRHRPIELIKSVCIGALPAIFWSAFSLYYYGFLFPNTAYAKLATGHSMKEMVFQGFNYYLQSWRSDPLTLIVLAVGIVVGFASKLSYKLISVGIILNLLYILYIGGDFMQGRFFTVPFCLSLFMIAQCLRGDIVNVAKRSELVRRTGNFFNGSGDFKTFGSEPRREVERVVVSPYIRVCQGAFLVVFVAVGLPNINAIMYSDPNAYYKNPYDQYTIFRPTGVNDEKKYYFHGQSLARSGKDFYKMPEWTTVGKEKKLIVAGKIGFFGFREGPAAHIIDPRALIDPLLARLPSQGAFGPGHNSRQIPLRYVESIRENENLLEDPETKDFYELIRVVTRAPLNTRARLVAILRLNFTRAKKISKSMFEMYRYRLIPITGDPIGGPF